MLRQRKKLMTGLASHDEWGGELAAAGSIPPLRLTSFAASSRLVCDFVQQFAGRIEQLNSDGDGSVGVGRATEAGIVGADYGGNVVQHAFGEFRAVDVVFGDLLDAASDGEIVVAGGDDQVGPGDGAVFVYFVVMNESAAGGLDHADALEGVDSGGGADVWVENL